MAAEAQRGDGDFDDDDPDDDESPVMAVMSTIDRIHDLPELFARAASFDSDGNLSPKSRWDFGCRLSLVFGSLLQGFTG
ncbi:unnamed protein product [Malus baccata var. baccata]|uniref:Uncharacterized protein n=1 Tax=Malus domestica TaxID=3750 RepID=A0A498JH54_MALDO|nr:hypothetical protein DVH24_013588 [Malus domestica]